MLDKLQNFIGIRRIVAFLLTLVFCYLSIEGKVNTNDFLSVFTMVIGVYFGHSIASKTNEVKGE